MFKRIQDWLHTAGAAPGEPEPPTLDADAPTHIAATGALDDTRVIDTGASGLGSYDSNVQGRFTPVRELGRGGMCSVHESEDLRLVRHTALKVMHPPLAANPAVRRQFIVEAQVTAQLEHPNIIPIYEYGQDPAGVPYINMRKVSGDTLGAAMHADHDRRLHRDNLLRVVRALVKVCDALAYAHSRGVVHRDLKPANVMVGQFGEVYVMDWGIALTGVAPHGDDPVRIEAALADDGAYEGPYVGTPAYMAPEQTTGVRSDIDQRTDVFLIGATLYELLTGRAPYRGASTLEETVRLAERGAYEAVGTCVPTHRPPPALVRIVDRAMAADPERRFQSMEALRRALEGFLEGSADLTVERYAPGEIIVREGEPGERAFVIVRGQCLVFSDEGGERRTLRRLGAGDVFGEMAILSGGHRTSSVEAETEVELEIVTREALTGGLGVKTWVGKFVLALAERFKEVDRRARAGRP